MKLDPIKLEVYKNLFSSLCEEMGVTLMRSSYSPNIKERRDFSCALFDEKGKMVEQAAHIPVHLGSTPLSVQAAIKEIEFKDGDTVILNDPYKGGTHLPDITMVTPVFIKNKIAFYVANRAHHSDVGGITPGSMPLAQHIDEEGIRISPTKIIENHKLNQKFLKEILKAVRTPIEREGDLRAQLAANRLGIERLQNLVSTYGLREIHFYMKSLQDHTEKITRQCIKNIPNGTYEFHDYLDDDGFNSNKIKIALKLTIKNDEAIIDFSNSDREVKGPVNSIYAITLSACFYVFRCLLPHNISTNDGGFRPLKLIAPEGSIVNAKYPAPVSAGNVETSQRIVDVLLGALAKAIPQKIPAASGGSMNNLTIGGLDSRLRGNDTIKHFTYYETIACGSGALPYAHGASGVQTHMTNTLNTPIEALEHGFPFRITSYYLRKNSGGKGKFRGGDGVVREYKFQSTATVTVISDRRQRAPYGLNNGKPAKVGQNFLNGKKISGKTSFEVKKGDILRIETPGGGGWG